MTNDNDPEPRGIARYPDAELLPSVNLADLTGSQTRALNALIAGASTLDAAKAADVTRRAVQRWLHLPAFRTALAEHRREALTALRFELAEAGLEAIDVLRRTLRGEVEPHYVVGAAAGRVLDALRAFEGEDVEARLRSLELELADDE